MVRGEGETAVVVVPWLEEGSAPGHAADAATAGRDRQRVAAGLVGGAGLVGVGTAVALGVAAKSRFDQASADCNGDHCNAPGVALRADAVERAKVATVVFGVSAAVLVGGGVLWFTAPGTTRSGASALQFGPALGGLVVRGEF